MATAGVAPENDDGEQKRNGSYRNHENLGPDFGVGGPWSHGVSGSEIFGGVENDERRSNKREDDETAREVDTA